MPESIPLTPEAARLVAAFDAVMDSAGVLEGATDALAAASAALARQIKHCPVPAATNRTSPAAGTPPPPPEPPSMPESIPLTPEAAAVVAAFDLVMDLDDSTGLYEDSRRALAAALRELAAVINGYIPPHTPYEGDKGYKTGLLRGISCVRFIADNIEQAITYAENQSNGN